ncbi:DUF4406 domain-containing protein [Muribaculum intestinale]|uniref:DUF4406 domain-containing protein n=1 Tax=Muribaculum intestinale TaxID=1796646 RepID=UPI0025B79127|nr:DUF4406 domain-containing protein [Muribaculum intestinale]
MKIYVSLPIPGHYIEQAKACASIIKQFLTSEWNTVITPFDVCLETDKPYSYYMGRDIEALLECDAIFMANGWESSKGCNLEYNAAVIYGKHIFTEIMLKNSKTLLL